MLIVANGHHWDARWPEPAFPGSDEFAGVQMHAHEYRDNESLRGKDVVVLGMGNSAMDIAVESGQVRRQARRTRRRYVASPRHTIQVDFDRYLHDLRKERRRGAERARAAGHALPVPARATVPGEPAVAR